MAGKHIGLALGSGSARGWAHLGVIQALEENDIPVDYIAGSSIGAVVGGMMAAGAAEQLREIALKFRWKQLLSFIDIKSVGSGLIDSKKVTDFILENQENILIEDLNIPFAAVSTDLIDGTEVVMTEGDLITAIRASISVPGIFKPVKINQRYLVDGGLVNPVPVSVVKDMGADIVIAVNLNAYFPGRIKSGKDSKQKKDRSSPEGKQSKSDNPLVQRLTGKFEELESSFRKQMEEWFPRDKSPSVFEVLLNSLHIMEYQIVNEKFRQNKPDVTITPRVEDIRMIEFYRAEETIKQGYISAKKSMGKIKSLLNSE